MPLDRTLARVDDDVAAGRYALARQRLRGLVASFPQRLELRERLAALYRREGDAAQAGRWSYLDEAADPGELEAFERAHRGDAVEMVKALGWRGSENEAPTEFARARLRALRARAEEQVGRAVTWEQPRRPESRTAWWEDVAGAVGVLLALVFLVLVLMGAANLAGHGLDVILGWFGQPPIW